jgi:hypothetical protein
MNLRYHLRKQLSNNQMNTNEALGKWAPEAQKALLHKESEQSCMMCRRQGIPAEVEEVCLLGGDIPD